MSLAGLSLDADSVGRHLDRSSSRGEGGAEVYRVAIPRMLDLLDRHEAKCTFFLVAAEARQHPEIVREIAWRGHEVASHSMTHPYPFRGLPEQQFRVEFEGSRRLLERLAGSRVDGFRAPSWDVSENMIGALVRSGYMYDASVYPSPMLLMLRASPGHPSGRKIGEATRSSLRAMFGPTGPHLLRRGLAEVPVCTSPGLRLPYYHTMCYLLPTPAWAALRTLVNAKRGPVAYHLHAADLLGLQEDGIDARFGRLPGMHLSLERKVALAEREIGWLARRRRVVPLRRLAEDVLVRSQPRLEASRHQLETS